MVALVTDCPDIFDTLDFESKLFPTKTFCLNSETLRNCEIKVLDTYAYKDDNGLPTEAGYEILADGVTCVVIIFNAEQLRELGLNTLEAVNAALQCGEGGSPLENFLTNDKRTLPVLIF